MSELYREQHPLLCDDFSEDELNTQNYSPRINPRMRQVIYSGRTKNQMKGAAAILTRWPEHWWSTLRYWWMGLGMTAIVVLIVYNSVIAFSMFPMTYTKILKPKTYNSFVNSLTEQSVNVFMHVFDDVDDELDLNDLLPYILIMSNRYQNFKFNLIVVKNDTMEILDSPLTEDSLDDESRNDIARNLLWSQESFDDNNDFKIISNNFVIRNVSINKYLNAPALKKYTKNVSKQFIEYLIRAVTVWEKSGIAFNPIILTPRSPNALYMEKIQYLFNKYINSDYKNNPQAKKTWKPQEVSVPKKRPNNIRDIIDALEVEDMFSNSSQYNLTAEDDKIYTVSIKSKDVRQILNNDNVDDPHQTHQITNGYELNNKHSIPVLSSDRLGNKNGASNHTEMKSKININNDTTKNSILPIFLEFLFPKREKNVFDNVNSVEDVKESNESNKIKDSEPRVLHHTTHEKDHHGTLSYNIKYNKRDLFSHKTEKREHDTNAQLTIDLRGNIIASNVKCHAFIGNLLSNAVHHTDGETLTEFIISELTIFCKGVLFSCKGIDVILL